MNNIKEELKKLVARNQPKISQGDSRVGQRLITVETKKESFDIPIQDFTIATQKTIL